MKKWRSRKVVAQLVSDRLKTQTKFLRLQSSCYRRVCKYIVRRPKSRCGCENMVDEGRAYRNSLNTYLNFLFYFVPVYLAIDVWKQWQNNKTSNEYQWKRPLSAPAMSLPVMWNSIVTSKKETIWCHIWSITEPLPEHTDFRVYWYIASFTKTYCGYLFVSFTKTISEGQGLQLANVWRCSAGWMWGSLVLLVLSCGLDGVPWLHIDLKRWLSMEVEEKMA